MSKIGRRRELILAILDFFSNTRATRRGIITARLGGRIRVEMSHALGLRGPPQIHC